MLRNETIGRVSGKILKFVRYAFVFGLVLTFAASAGEFGEAAAWLRDGSGDFSDQDPPHDWDASTGHNLLWAARLPNWSNGSPIVINGRVFVMCEPFTGLPELVCIDADTGKLLWRREVDWIAQLPEPEAKEVRRRLTGFYAWSSELLSQMAELLEMRRAGKKPVSEADKERWAQAEKRAKELGWSGKFGGRAGGATALVLTKTELTRDVRDFVRKYVPVYPAWGPGIGTYRWSKGFHHEPWEGMTFPTPVSDGKHVWVLTGHNVVACYDFDGELVWLHRFNSRPKLDDLAPEVKAALLARREKVSWPNTIPGGGDFSTSPRLMNGKLVVQAGKFVRAFEPDTGKLLWETPDCFPHGHTYGTPSYIEVSGVPAVITGEKGEVFRLSDGAFLGGPVAEGHIARVWRDVAVCLAKRGCAAFRLSLSDDDAPADGESRADPNVKHSGRLRIERLWESNVGLSHRYAIANDRLLSGGAIVDMKTGSTVAGGARNGLPHSRGRHTATILLKNCALSTGATIGHFVFVDTNTYKLIGDVEMEKDPLGDANADHVAARQGLKRWFWFGAAVPYAYRDRLYIRSHGRLYCIGHAVRGTPRDDPRVVAKIRGAKSVDAAAGYLESDSAQYRYEALRKLSATGDQSMSATLRRLAAGDPYAAIRSAALVALGVGDGEPGRELLSKQLTDAVDDMGRVKNDEVMSTLRSMDEDALSKCVTELVAGGDMRVSLAAAAACEHIGKALGDDLRDVLLAAMERDTGKWRHLAERSAGALKAWGADPVVMESFRKFLNKREIGAQGIIYAYLMRHASPKARLEACRSAALGNPDRHVKSMARDRLVEIAADNDEVLDLLVERASLGESEYSTALRSLAPAERRLSALRRVLASDKGAVAAAGVMLASDMAPVSAVKRLQELAPSIKDSAVPGVVGGLLRDAWRCTDKDARKRYASVLTGFLKRRENERFRAAVIDQLGRLGPDAAVALPELRAVSTSGDKRLADALSRAVKAIDPEGDKLLRDEVQEELPDIDDGISL